jgi:chromosome segregation ATPase
MNQKESTTTTTRDDIKNNNSSGYGQSPPAHTSPSSISPNAISSGVSAVKLLMPDPDLPTDVQLKLLRAHLEHAIDEATSAEREATRLKTDLAMSRKEVHKLSDEVARSTRALSSTEAAANTARALVASAEGRENDLRVQLQQLQREQSSSAKAKHSSGAHTEPSAVEARLHRANEEIEKLKCQLVNERKEAADLTSSLKRDLEVALERAKKSDRQRGELLAAFRKQLKLVDILRRQRVHMEAARMLGFAEEEFVKLMEQHGNK